MGASMEDIKKLRELTGAGVMDAKRALDESDGDMEKAQEWIAAKGMSRAEKKADRETGQGRVCTYTHHDGKSGAMVTLLCETDFVAKTDDFAEIGRNLAMQVTSMNPENEEAFLEQDYLRDPSMKIAEYIKTSAAKLGENVKLGSITRVSI